MMTKKLAILVPVLAVLALALAPMIGCGGDDTSEPDMSVTPSTCTQVALCAQSCTDAACVAACTAKGTSTAQTKFGAVQACGLTSCTMPGDAGAAKCSGQTDTSATCFACAAAAAANTSICGTQLSACLADK